MKTVYGVEFSTLNSKAYAVNIEKLKNIIRETPFYENIYYFHSIPSTNNSAKDIADKGEEKYALVVADSQSAGRGRQGRHWYSPSGEGAYLSLLVKPDFKIDNYFPFVIIGCLAVVDAIEKLYSKKADIKWPNDIMIDKKKCAGILVESSFKGDEIDYIVTGIGVNVNTSSFEKGYLHPPTSLMLSYGIKKEIWEVAGQLVDSFWFFYRELAIKNVKNLYEKYRGSLRCINKKVKLVDREVEIEGVAEKVDEKGCIYIKTLSGKIEKFSNGDLILLE